MKWMELECGTWLLAERQKRVNTFFYFPNFLFVPVVNSPAALPAKAGESAPFSRTRNSASILFSEFLLTTNEHESLMKRTCFFCSAPDR